MIGRYFILLIVSLTMAPAQAEEYNSEKLDKLLDHLETELAPITTIDATFKQYKYISLFDEVIEAKGRLLFQQPKSIRFEITHPFHSILIVANKKVAKYEMAKETWRRLKLRNTGALALVTNQIADWMKGNFRAQSRIFGLSAKAEEGTVLVLTPKPAAFAKVIQCIEIRLAKNETDFRSITIREPDGDRTVLEFIHDVKDRPLSDATFDTARKFPIFVAPSKE